MAWSLLSTCTVQRDALERQIVGLDSADVLVLTFNRTLSGAICALSPYHLRDAGLSVAEVV